MFRDLFLDDRFTRFIFKFEQNRRRIRDPILILVRREIFASHFPVQGPDMSQIQESRLLEHFPFGGLDDVLAVFHASHDERGPWMILPL